MCSTPTMMWGPNIPMPFPTISDLGRINETSPGSVSSTVLDTKYVTIGNRPLPRPTRLTRCLNLNIQTAASSAMFNRVVVGYGIV